MTTPQSHSAGFTLVELSIVLVIVGLLVGGALTGRQIMQNAQVTNAVNSLQAYQAQFQTYMQNYGVMPGDDPNAPTRFSNSGIDASWKGDGLGSIDGCGFDSAAATGTTAANTECNLLWAHMRAAGLVKGSGTNATQPTNPFGGIYGFQHSAFSGTYSFTTNVICLNNVPGDAAASIDARLDDGIAHTGSMMGMIATGKTGEAYKAGTVAVGTYVASQNYTMCLRM